MQNAEPTLPNYAYLVCFQRLQRTDYDGDLLSPSQSCNCLEDQAFSVPSAREENGVISAQYPDNEMDLPVVGRVGKVWLGLYHLPSLFYGVFPVGNALETCRAWRDVAARSPR
jgi:hypothetical protein